MDDKKLLRDMTREELQSLSVKDFAKKYYNTLSFFVLLFQTRGAEDSETQRIWKEMVEIIASAGEIE